jgi:general secretion pathway protein K
MIRVFSDRKAFLLVSSLWILGFLTVLAVALGMGARQKILVLKRIEERASSRMAAEAGAKKTIAVFLDELENAQFTLTSKTKARLYNNPSEFLNIPVGDFRVDVVNRFFDERSGKIIERYGLEDEQSKLNLNTVDPDTLTLFLQNILQDTESSARALAIAIIDWRAPSQQESTGFSSDGYYKGLEYPYEAKGKSYERIDELLLIKGVTQQIFDTVRPFVTVYGDGHVNINTVSAPVLEALGLDPLAVDKILKARSGVDGADSTADDHIFLRAFDVAAEVKALVTLDEKYARQIDALNARGILATGSFIVSFQSRAFPVDGRSGETNVDVVFNALTSRIQYWNEK